MSEVGTVQKSGSDKLHLAPSGPSAIRTEVEQIGCRERALRVARDSGIDCSLEDFDFLIGVREGYRSRNQLARAASTWGLIGLVSCELAGFVRMASLGPAGLSQSRIRIIPTGQRFARMRVTADARLYWGHFRISDNVQGVAEAECTSSSSQRRPLRRKSKRISSVLSMFMNLAVTILWSGP